MAIDLQALGPWAGLGLGLAGGFILGIGSSLIANKIQRMIDEREAVDTKDYYEVSSDQPGESLPSMMARLVGELSRQLDSSYGVVVSEVNALRDVQVPFYELQAVSFKRDGQPDFHCDLFTANLNGYLELSGFKPDGSGAYLIESSGHLGLEAVNFGRPDESWKFYFGQ
ncbi:hypothetical protein LshimejAT787_1104610 [Lyophyllum shimeji]|uniref:Uncharacterized protein n=1 Tax=Lyophyllum shimeji TaxID=47721 RepID=A0A9P3UTS1_LYOSH|nr:hypothetical protein LshimejAT787_1104610 [Lyophyllum shimeji]